jgi:CarD family transcriptional regulator
MTKSKKSEFCANEYVVYPAQGVGQIVSIEEQEIAGISMELFVISFEKTK